MVKFGVVDVVVAAVVVVVVEGGGARVGVVVEGRKQRGSGVELKRVIFLSWVGFEVGVEVEVGSGRVLCFMVFF